MNITFPFKLPTPSGSIGSPPPQIPRTCVIVNVKSPKYKGTQMREKKLTDLIEAKVAEAKAICDGDRESNECKVAWDEVEEVSQAKADLRRKLDKNKDPLEAFCKANPETDECRIYED